MLLLDAMGDAVPASHLDAGHVSLAAAATQPVDAGSVAPMDTSEDSAQQDDAVGRGGVAENDATVQQAAAVQGAAGADASHGSAGQLRR